MRKKLVNGQTHFNKFEAAYTLNNTIRHVGVLINKTEHRRRELDALQTVLARIEESSELVAVLRNSSWYSLRDYVDRILDSEDASRIQNIKWVRWASKAMVEDYELNDYFAYEGLLIRFYETYRQYLVDYTKNDSPGTLEHNDLKPIEKLMDILHFDPVLKSAAVFLRFLRNDLVHNRSMARQKTVEALNNFSDLTDLTLVEGLPIQMKWEHGLICLNKLFYGFMKHQNISQQDFGKYFDQIQNSASERLLHNEDQEKS